MLRASVSPIGPGRGLACSGAASAWTPAALGASLLLWLRADDGITLTSSHVTQWDGVGGVGASVAPTGGSTTQPIMDTWSGGIGGAALRFDGNDVLATAANILPTSSGAGFSIFVVGSFDDTNFRCKFLTNGTSGGVAVSQNGGSSGKLQEWKIGVSFSDNGAARTTPFSMLLVDQVGATPGTEMYVDGALVSTTGPNAQVGTPSGRLYIGASVSSNFDMGLDREFIVINGRVSAATQALLFAYSLARNGV